MVPWQGAGVLGLGEESLEEDKSRAGAFEEGNAKLPLQQLKCL